MAENQSKKQDKQHQIPMMVTDEVIRDFGIKPEEVTWRRSGRKSNGKTGMAAAWSRAKTAS